MADDRGGQATGLLNLLIGPPKRASHDGSGKDRITPVQGLSALSLDALTSVAYGPEAIILVLAVAGAGALHLVLPVTIAIVGLPDARTGERACAVIVARAGAAPDVENLGRYLKTLGVASFKIPEQVVVWEALPKNDAGKVLKHQIRATLAPKN